MSLEILVVQYADGNTCEHDVIYCQTVTGRTTLTVINKSLAKKATCGLQNLSTLTCSHRGRDQKYTLTATGSNEYLV